MCQLTRGNNIDCQQLRVCQGRCLLLQGYILLPLLLNIYVLGVEVAAGILCLPLCLVLANAPA